MLDHQSILNALQPVQDPELKKSLVTLNMIRNVSIKDSTVEFTLVLTTPACPLKELIIQDCEKALKEINRVLEPKGKVYLYVYSSHTKNIFKRINLYFRE